MDDTEMQEIRLNPHVVGRFFREFKRVLVAKNNVLIPMWWGGFSEVMNQEKYLIPIMS